MPLCDYKQDLTKNNPNGLICYKTQPTYEPTKSEYYQIKIYFGIS